MKRVLLLAGVVAAASLAATDASAAGLFRKRGGCGCAQAAPVYTAPRPAAPCCGGPLAPGGVPGVMPGMVTPAAPAAPAPVAPAMPGGHQHHSAAPTPGATGASFVSANLPKGAETVELKKVHMCCDGCAEEVATVLGKVEGVSGVSTDKKATSAAFTAADAKAAQRALDALAAAGFHGDPGKDKGYAFKDDSGVKPGAVKTLTVNGFHNSCGGCVKSFKDALKGVKGVAGVTAKSKVSSAEVTGDFDAAEVVKALNAAGFHVKVEEKK